MTGKELLQELDEKFHQLNSKELQGDAWDKTKARVIEIRKKLHGKKAIILPSTNFRLPRVLGTIDTNNYVCSNAFYIRFEEKVVTSYPTPEGTEVIEKVIKDHCVVYPRDVEIVE